MKGRLGVIVLIAALSMWCTRALCVAADAASAPEATPAAAAVPAAPATPAATAAPAATSVAEATTAAAATDVPAPAETTAAEGAAARELTMGEAFMLKMKQGGRTMIFLFLASVAGVAYTIERLVNLRARRIVPSGLAEQVDKLWRAGKFEEIENLPEKNNSTLARVLSVVARHRHSSMADVSMMAGEVASRDLRRHLQRAYPLAIVATVSPLLGLFGTVIGMIGAFDKVSAAGALGDASLLGGDIAKALITTAAGLTIAIPALVFYHYFKNRTSQFALEVEEEVSELISEWYGSAADHDAAPVEASTDEG